MGGSGPGSGLAGRGAGRNHPDQLWAARHDATPLSLTIILLTAFGGLLVAFVVKYTDTVIKSLATGSVIVLTTLVEYMYMDGPIGCG